MQTIGTSIEFQMSLLLCAALAGHLLAIGLRQPAVVGEILMGLVLGPSLLGWITYTEFVSGIAQLGAIVLVFVVGLEFKLRDILKLENVIIALFGVITACAAGYWLALLFGFDHHRAFLVGVGLSATSIAITADVLRETGQLHTNTAKTIVGAAVLGNVAALLALSHASRLEAGGIGLLQSLVLVAKGLLFLAAAAIFGRVILVRWIIHLDRTAIANRYPQFVFIFAMLIAFAYAMFAERSGLSAILGAFVAGISLEGIELRVSRRFTDGADFLRILFGAVFFVSLGVLADLRSFTTHELVFVLTLTAAAVFSKLIGCGLPALALGKNLNEAMMVGMGMVPRGEVAMVIALLALNGGFIEQPAYASLVIMSLLTIVVTPAVLKKLIARHVN